MNLKSLYISYNGITEPIVRSQVLPYLQGLSKKGLKFYLLTFEKERLSKNKIDDIKADLIKRFGKGHEPEWFFLQYHKSPTIPATAFDVICGFFYSLYIILKNKIDIVHGRAIVAALSGYSAARVSGKKFIFDTRGVDSEEYVDAGLWKKGGFKHRLTAFFEDALIRSSDYVIVLTEKFLGVLEKRHQGKNIKFSVIPCAVDTDRFFIRENDGALFEEDPALKGKFIIVYTGSLGSWYMLDEMLDFFKIALQRIKNAHFLILTQSDKEYVRKSVKRKGLDESLVTIGSTTYDEMPRRLSSCDMGLFFIKPVFSKLSSSPVKFGEYLSCGLPVIINAGIGDTEGIIKDYKVGAVVDRFNEEDYRAALDAVTTMLKDGKAGLKERCRSCAEKEFALDKAVEDYYRIYEEVARKG